MTDAQERLSLAFAKHVHDKGPTRPIANAIAAFVEERVQTEALARHNQDLQRDKTILHHAERLRATEQQLEAVERRLDAWDNTEDCYWSQGVEDDVTAAMLDSLDAIGSIHGEAADEIERLRRERDEARKLAVLWRAAYEWDSTKIPTYHFPWEQKP